MKNLIAFVFVLLMSATSFAGEKENPTSKEVKKEIRTKIVKLLGNADFNFNQEIKTSIDVLINKKGEIVVLNIDCSNPTVCAYVKRKLNYKKVVNNFGRTVKMYKVPLRIVKQL